MSKLSPIFRRYYTIFKYSKHIFFSILDIAELSPYPKPLDTKFPLLSLFPFIKESLKLIIVDFGLYPLLFQELFVSQNCIYPHI